MDHPVSAAAGAAQARPTTRITLNGVAVDAQLSAERSLLEVLREDLHLTGAKPGCGEGACGACTVLLDGEPVRACVIEASAAADRTVTTIEGLAVGRRAAYRAGGVRARGRDAVWLLHARDGARGRGAARGQSRPR